MKNYWCVLMVERFDHKIKDARIINKVSSDTQPQNIHTDANGYWIDKEWYGNEEMAKMKVQNFIKGYKI